MTAAQEISSTFSHYFAQARSGLLDDYYDVDKSKLGEGSFGSCYKGINKETHALRAIKAVRKGDENNICQRSFRDEVDTLSSLNHPNIVKLHEVFEDARCYYLVMDLCSGGELFDRILEAADAAEAGSGDGTLCFTERKAASYMTQILGAVSYIHSRNIVHRDIKPENLLLQNETNEAQIKLADFGAAIVFQPGHLMTRKAGGFPFYVAPEVLARAYDEKCDVWGCGVVSYIMLCGSYPFYGDTNKQVLELITKGQWEFSDEEWRNVTNDAKDLIRQMLTQDPNKRPSAADILNHKWMSTNAEAPDEHIPKDLFTKLKKFQRCSKLKKVALTLITQQIKDEDLKELQRTFSKLDKNTDGTLTFEEIKEGVESSGVQVTSKDMQDILLSLDTDGSGNIDYAEFLAATLSTKQYLKEDVMWAAFRVFDRDCDGIISKQELAQVLNTPDIKHIEDMIKEVDLDGDGTISFGEFVSMMEKGTNGKVTELKSQEETETLLKAFKASDADGKGTISQLEFAALLRAIDAEIDFDSTDAMFKAADADGNGVIDYQELVAWLFRGSPPPAE